jgi:hypothetical protein
MMTALQIRERLYERPFRPFRITMSDGRVFDVPNYEAAYVKKNTVEVGTNLDASSFADSVPCSASLRAHLTF